MGSEIAKIEQAAHGGSVTRFSSQTSKLAASIPRWVDLGALDASDMYGYGHPLPDGGASELIAAAHEHDIALAPAVPEETDKILRGLRSATILLTEDPVEARASFAMLRTHLADVPFDILAEGCRLYCNAPGKRFFPRSAGELRTFIDPIVRHRRGRAVRLERLAKQAHDEQVERDRLAADPCTPEGIAAAYAEFGIRSAPVAESAKAARTEATTDDYLALGLSEDEARAAMGERQRLLARRRGPTFGAVAQQALDSAAAAISEGRDA